MEIKKLEVGSLETNCYILQADDELAVVDPGADPERIISELETIAGTESRVKFVLATHFHWDHVEGAGKLVDRLDTECYLGEKDRELFTKSIEADLSPTRLLKEGDSVEVSSSKLEVLETPGHSPGSITLVDRTGNNLLVGDLLFSTGFGRTDLPGGSKADLEDSLARIVNLTGDWKVFPGHGPVFNLKDKLASSPFLSELKQG